MSVTTYMGLTVPDVGITIGPTWAQYINAALSLIDSHDHTTGKGATLTQASLSINGDLALNGYSLTTVKSVSLSNQGATLSGNGLVYRVGSNLYYNNGSGVPIQITSGTAVNAPGSGAISASVISSYPYTVVSGDAQKVLIIDTTAARTVNLPAATTAMFVMVKDGPGSARTNRISVVPDGTDTIDGANSTYFVDYDFGSIGLVSDGVTKWYVV